MHELVDHDVVALGGGLAGVFHVAPRQHHRPAVHRLAGELFLEVVHDAVVVDHLALRHDHVGMHHDADEAVVPVQPEVEHRQAGLRGDRTRPSGRRPPGPARRGTPCRRGTGWPARAGGPCRPRCARSRNGKRASASCHSASGIARCCSVLASRQRLNQPAKISPRLAVRCGCRPVRDQRSTSARGVAAWSRSQSLSTWRVRPGCSSWSAGRCVWPCTSTGVSAARIQSTVAVGSRSSHSGGIVPWRRSLSWRTSRASARRSASGRASTDACQAGLRTIARKLWYSVSARHSASPWVSSSAFAERRHDGRVGEGVTLHADEHVGADQEVAVADHERDGPARGCLAQHLGALRLEALEARVVADPHLEQVAEDEHRVGPRAAHVARPGLEATRRVGRQMQVADEVDRLPVVRRVESTERGQGERSHRGPLSISSDARSANDRHVFERHVAVAALAAGLDLLDRVDHLGARHHLARTPRSPSPKRSRR